MDSALIMIPANLLSPDERVELERSVVQHREEHGIARRANTILVLNKGKTCVQIAAYCPHLNPIERLWAILHA